jgi:hypothetical protein
MVDFHIEKMKNYFFQIFILFYKFENIIFLQSVLIVSYEEWIGSL